MFFVDLRVPLFYVKGSSHLELVRGTLNSSKDAPAGEDPPNLTKESRNVIEIDWRKVWETEFNLHVVKLILKLRTVDKRVFQFYKDGAWAAVITWSVFHAWEEIPQKAGLSLVACFAHRYLFLEKLDGQFEVTWKPIYDFSSDRQLKRFSEGCTSWTKEDRFADWLLSRETCSDIDHYRLCQFVVSYMQVMLQNGLLYRLLNKPAQKLSL